jgi:hypothetical protein
MRRNELDLPRQTRQVECTESDRNDVTRTESKQQSEDRDGKLGDDPQEYFRQQGGCTVIYTQEAQPQAHGGGWQQGATAIASSTISSRHKPLQCRYPSGPMAASAPAPELGCDWRQGCKSVAAMVSILRDEG